MKTLINEIDFKEYSPVPNNFNIKAITPFFAITENAYIKPILGVALFEQLLSEIEQEQITPDNQKLLSYIIPYDAIAITYECLPFITYKFSEGGITKFKNDYSESISADELNNLSSYLSTQMQILKNELLKFLEENKEKFPLYRSESDECKPIDKSGLRLYSNNKRY